MRCVTHLPAVCRYGMPKRPRNWIEVATDRAASRDLSPVSAENWVTATWSCRGQS